MKLSSLRHTMLITFCLASLSVGCGGDDTGGGAAAGAGGSSGNGGATAGSSGSGGNAVAGNDGGGGALAGSVEDRCLEGQCNREQSCDPTANLQNCQGICSGAVAGTAEREGAECQTAYQELFDCTNMLGCQDFLTFRNGSAVDYPCRRPDYDVFIDCNLDPASCFRACDVRIACGSGTVGCAADCDELYRDEDNFSDACAEGLMALNQCVAALDCTQFANFEAQTGTYPCQAQQEAFDALQAAGCQP